MPYLHVLARPAGLILLAANAIPLLGVLFLHWDAFLLLLLYWTETAIIGFWTIWLMANISGRLLGSSKTDQALGKASIYLQIGFLVMHAGIFMSVHFFFLWMLFSGAWRTKVHNVWGFVELILIGQGLWLPLVALFIARGIEPVLLVYGPDWYRKEKWGSDNPKKTIRDRLVKGFYSRIVVMQIAIIGSGFVVTVLGGAAAIAPLIFIVLLKTLIDLGLFLRDGFGVKAAT